MRSPPWHHHCAPSPIGDLMGTRAVTSLWRSFDNASLRPRVLPSPLIWVQGPAEHSPWGLRALRRDRTTSQLVHQPTSLCPWVPPSSTAGSPAGLSAPKSKPTTSPPPAGPAGQGGHPSGPVAALGALAGEGRRLRGGLRITLLRAKRPVAPCV